MDSELLEVRSFMFAMVGCALICEVTFWRFRSALFVIFTNRKVCS
jgi:hypothetical protein